jgi:hypothetical protein
MKAYILPVSVLISILFFNSCKPSGKAAAQYNNKIVHQQVRIGTLQKEMFQVFSSQKADEMKVVLDKFKQGVKAVSDSVAALPAFDGKEEFKKETLNYFDQMNKIADNECATIVKLYQIPDSLYTDADEKKVQDLLNAMNEKTKSALKNLEQVQQKFSLEYNFEVSK